jgi:hypothetical protein
MNRDLLGRLQGIAEMVVFHDDREGVLGLWPIFAELAVVPRIINGRVVEAPHQLASIFESNDVVAPIVLWTKRSS